MCNTSVTQPIQHLLCLPLLAPVTSDLDTTPTDLTLSISMQEKAEFSNTSGKFSISNCSVPEIGSEPMIFFFYEETFTVI